MYVFVYCLPRLPAPSPRDCELLKDVLSIILTTCTVSLLILSTCHPQFYALLPHFLAPG